MLRNKFQLKHPLVDNPPPLKRGKKALYGCSASIMLAFMVSASPYVVAQDDDSDKNIRGTIQFTEGKYEVPEMAGKAVLCVERRGGNNGDIMAMYGTTSGSAKPESDYVPAMGHLMWRDGDDSTKPIMIHIKKDKAPEKEKESFYVTLLDMARMDTGDMQKDDMPPPPDGMQKDDMPPPDGMQKDGMQPPPDGMMAPDMDMAQYCGGMSKDDMSEDMSKDDMMDEMGNPATVYFGGRFQAEVKIVDNKEPPPPPPGQAKPDQPGQPAQPGQPDQGTDTTPSDDDDDVPSVMTPGDPPAASQGEAVKLTPNSSLFTNIFSVKQSVVVSSEISVSGVVQITQKIVSKLTVGVSKKVGVIKARLKIKTRIRSGDEDEDGFDSDVVEAFFDLVESLYPDVDRNEAIEGTFIGSTGDLCLPTQDEDVLVCIDPSLKSAIATPIAAAIVEHKKGAELVINQENGTVTYIPADGPSITVIPDAVVTTASDEEFNVTVNGNTIVVNGNGLSQTFTLVTE